MGLGFAKRYEELNKTTMTYKEKVFDLISSSTNTADNLFDLINNNDKLAEEYINHFLDVNDKLKPKYQSLEYIEDIYERFCKTIDLEIEEQAKNLAKAMSELTNAFIPIQEKIKKALSSFHNLAINKITEQARLNYEKIKQGLNSLAKIISNAIAKISTPNISDERKKELENSFKLWGKYGWTSIGIGPIDLFFEKPASCLDADKVALKYCDNKFVEECFKDSLKLLRRKKDLQEAFDCFNNKHYKACAMLLFSIIDALLIRKQKAVSEVKTGIGAILDFKENLKQQIDTNIIYIYLNMASVFACLCTFFDGTDNFKKKVSWPNRNYLNHGMSSKSIRKKDCIKLFLLLDNLLQLIDFSNKELKKKH